MEMGEVRVKIVVANPRTGARSEELTALADTGATLSVLPREVLEQLGIEKVGSAGFLLADGRRTERDIGDAAIALHGGLAPCRVVFAEPGDAVLLGLTALEQLGLAVDPVQRKLVRTDFLLY